MEAKKVGKKGVALYAAREIAMFACPALRMWNLKSLDTSSMAAM